MSTTYFSRKLFESILDRFDENTQDLDYAFDPLYHMFKDEIIESLTLIETNSITILYSNKRQIYEVKGNNNVYYCFYHTYFCTCLSYALNVVKSNDIILCKHLIASRISIRIKKCKYKLVDDEYLTRKFIGFEDRDSQDKVNR